MRKNRDRKKSIVFLTALLMMPQLMTGCGKNPPTLDNGENSGGEESVYHMVYFSEINSLNYLQTDTEIECALCANLIDNLVDYDSYGNIVPGLAESWSSNDDMTEWTFHIRPGVKWVDCNGKEAGEVCAEDWVTAAWYVNDAVNDAACQYIYDTGSVVHNAQNYYDYTEYMMLSAGGTRTTDEDGNELEPVPEVKPEEIGVKAIDDHTLVYTLDQPCPFFLSCLSYGSFMPVNREFLNQCGDMFGRSKENLLYCGAYRLEEFIPQEKRILVKNGTYWDIDNVHIDRIEAMFRKDILEVSPEMFLNGEIDQALITYEMMDQWMANPDTASQIHSMRPDISYSYFYCFNFDPEFDAAKEPENWRLAVRNEDFRKALMHSLDHRALAEVYEPYNPEILLQKTITPRTFVTCGNRDYTDFDPFAQIMDTESFNSELAREYRDRARTALEAEGVTFPVKVTIPYNPSISNWAEECQVAKQQLEDTLGTDFVQVIVERGPDTGFLSAVRRSGKYALMLCNYGADFADPATYADPFSDENTYNFWYRSGDPEIDALFAEYNALVSKALGTVGDDETRYELFAEAEALLIEHAIVIPSRVSNGEGYVVDRLSQFDGQFAPYGLARSRYKGMVLHENSMSMEEFNEAYEQWEEERLNVAR